LPVCRPSAWHRRIGGSGFQAGTQCSEPVRRQAGRRGKRPRHCDAAEHNGAELTLNLAFQHVRERRHARAVELGIALEGQLQQHADFLAGDPVRLLRLGAGPAPGRIAIELAALDRKCISALPGKPCPALAFCAGC